MMAQYQSDVGVDGFDRRAFLRGTRGLAAATAAVTLGGACTRDVPPKPAGITVLTDQQAATLAALAETLFPGTDEMPGAVDLDAVATVDRALAAEGPIMQAKIADAILFLEWAPQFSRVFKPFSALPPDKRVWVFQSFAHSRLRIKRAIFAALKGLLGFAYFSDPKVWSHMGYDGPWVGVKPDPEPLRYASDSTAPPPVDIGTPSPSSTTASTP